MSSSSGSRIFPALFLTFNDNTVRDSAFNQLTVYVAQMRKVKQKPLNPTLNETTRLFEKGTIFTVAAIDLFSIGVGAGGGTPNHNYHFYIVVEKLGEKQIVLATHGNDSLRTSFLKDSFAPVITQLNNSYPLEAEWGTSLELPKNMIASPKGFRKHLGLTKWFFLT